MAKKKPEKDEPEAVVDNPPDPELFPPNEDLVSVGVLASGDDLSDPGWPRAGEAPAAAAAAAPYIDEDMRAKFRLIYELETRSLKGHGLDPDRDVMLRAAQELRVLYGLPADQKLDPTGAFTD